MIKLSILMAILLVFLSFFTNSAKAKTTKAKTVKIENAMNLQESDKKGKSQILLHRLNEIKQMDKSHLSEMELNQLLNEVRAINIQLKVIDGGIFISAGALIVILIVLIFFL